MIYRADGHCLVASRQDAERSGAYRDESSPTGSTMNVEALQNHGPTGMPTTIFISPDGEIVRQS